MEAVNLPVIHPSFRNLQRNGRLLHLMAALLLLTHAITHFRERHPDPFYIACLFIMALDILILLITVRQLLAELPRVNLIFRLMESLFFLGIGFFLLTELHRTLGVIHLLIGLAYLYLFHCERKLGRDEFLSLQHTGIRIPELPATRFLKWSAIASLRADYHSIHIELNNRKQFHFRLRQQLAFGDLDQIHEFCRHYMGEGGRA